ncbi:hypothetical protein ACFLSA_05335 [Bacteroidota bacterium]
MNQLIIWIHAGALAFFLKPVTVTDEKENITYQFTSTDSGYSFYGSFNISSKPECLLEICFEYEHIRALAPDAQEVILLDQGKNWNKISYTYLKFLYFENKSVWYRILDEENQKVNFSLVSSENNRSIMPQLISSDGYYQLKQQGKSFLLEYFQQFQITEARITKLYLNRVKKEAIKFMYGFFQFTKEHCSDIKSID